MPYRVARAGNNHRVGDGNIYRGEDGYNHRGGTGNNYGGVSGSSHYEGEGDNFNRGEGNDRRGAAKVKTSSVLVLAA